MPPTVLPSPHGAPPPASPEELRPGQTGLTSGGVIISYRQQRRIDALQNPQTQSSYSLRPYQQDAVDKVLAAWQQNQHLDALVCLATGLGKTEVGIEIINALPAGLRTLCLVHRRNLVLQMANRMKLRHACWEPEIGLLMGGQADLDRRITVGTIQSLAGSRRQPLARLEPLLAAGPIDLLVIDECHHAVSASYIAALAALRERNPALRHLGLTATPSFQGKANLSKIYHLMEYKSVRWGVENGFLVPPVGLKVVTDIDLSQVRQSDGDFEDAALGKVLNTPGFNRLAAKIYQDYLRGVRTLVFCATVAHAQAVRDEFRAAHIPTEMIVASTPDDERQAIVGTFVAGEIQVLVNVGVLAEGSDIPAAEGLLNLRPTRSSVLYTQIVGRVLRLAPGKTRATVVDFTASGQTLYTLDDLMEGQTSEPEVEATVKQSHASHPRPPQRAAEAAADPTKFWTQIVDLLRQTRLAWYTSHGRSVMQLKTGYALLMPPGGASARAQIEQLLTRGRAGEQTGARNECLEWQLAHLDDYVLYHVTETKTSQVDWDRDYSLLVSVASTWAESLKSNSFSLRESIWRPSPATSRQIHRLVNDGTLDSDAWLEAQERQAGARLSIGLASSLISYRNAMHNFKKGGFAWPPYPAQSSEEKAVAFRRLLLEQGLRTAEAKPAAVPGQTPGAPKLGERPAAAPAPSTGLQTAARRQPTALPRQSQ